MAVMSGPWHPLQVDRYADLDLDVARDEFAHKLDIDESLILFSSMIDSYQRQGVHSAQSLRSHLAELIAAHSVKAATALQVFNSAGQTCEAFSESPLIRISIGQARCCSQALCILVLMQVGLQ